MAEWESLTSDHIVNRRVPESGWGKRLVAVSLVTVLALAGMMVASFLVWSDPPKTGVLSKVERLDRGVSEAYVETILGPTDSEPRSRIRHWHDEGGYVSVEFDENRQVTKIEAGPWHRPFLSRVGRLFGL